MAIPTAASRRRRAHKTSARRKIQAGTGHRSKAGSRPDRVDPARRGSAAHAPAGAAPRRATAALLPHAGGRPPARVRPQRPARPAPRPIRAPGRAGFPRRRGRGGPGAPGVQAPPARPARLPRGPAAWRSTARRRASAGHRPPQLLRPRRLCAASSRLSPVSRGQDRTTGSPVNPSERPNLLVFSPRFSVAAVRGGC